MIDPSDTVIDWADPTTEYFWESARHHQLVIQQCTSCGTHQFYPRPFCLSCDSDDVEWVAASGFGSVYSRTTIHLPAAPELGLTVPYVAAIIELDEGPRLLTNLTSDSSDIGDRVQVEWRPREGQAPVPIFGPVEATAGGGK
ncbi:MAG: Zn-ribbon domain-containing OB-fold protein [Homoserinimonas sp.]